MIMTDHKFVWKIYKYLYMSKSYCLSIYMNCQSKCNNSEECKEIKSIIYITLQKYILFILKIYLKLGTLHYSFTPILLLWICNGILNI